MKREKSLLEECIETFVGNVTVLNQEESDKITTIISTIAPFGWSRIDWEKVPKKKLITPENDIIRPLIALLNTSIDQDIYVIWNDAALPVLKTTLNAGVLNFENLFRNGIEMYFLNTTQWYIYEFYSQDYVGLFPDFTTAELENRKEYITFKNKPVDKTYQVIEGGSEKTPEITIFKELLLSLNQFDSTKLQHLLAWLNNNDVAQQFVIENMVINKKTDTLELHHVSTDSTLVIATENLIQILRKWQALIKHAITYAILERHKKSYSLSGTQKLPK